MNAPGEDIEVDLNDSGPTVLMVIACYALANLSRANDDFALQTLDNNLFQSLSSIILVTKSIRVMRQVVHCIDAICNAFVRRRSEQLILDDFNLFAGALKVLAIPIACPSKQLQLWALSSMASIVLLNPKLRHQAVEGPLREVIHLLANSNDRDIGNAVDDILIRLGFSGGLTDFYICDRDYDSIRFWYRIKQSVNLQKAGQKNVKRWLFDSFQSRARTASSFTDPISVRDNLTDSMAVETLAACLGSYDDDNADIRSLISSSNSFDFSKFEDHFDLSNELKIQALDAEEHYPIGAEYQLSLFSASHLQRMVNMGLLSLGIVPSSQIVSKVADMKGIYFSRHQQQSLSFIYKVVKHIADESVKVNPVEYWSLTFDDCVYDEEFHAAIISAASNCPHLRSFSFRSSSDRSRGTLLGLQLSKLPPSVAFVSFDGSISEQQIQIFCTALRTSANLNPNSSGKDSGGLSGLAFTHLALDRSSALNDIISLLKALSPANATITKTLNNVI